MKKNDPSFSLNDFRKWLSGNPNNSISFFDDNRIKKGDKILVRLSENNMIKKLSPLNEDKNINSICKELKKNGGIVQEIYSANASIKIIGINESLIVPRLFLRRPKNSS